MAARWIFPLRALAERRTPFFSFSFSFSFSPPSSSSYSSIPLAPSSSSLLSSSATPELCGRGDRKTKKGKRFRGTYGKARPKKDKKIARFKEKVEVPPSTPWPLPFKLI